MISKCLGKPSKGVGDVPEDKAEESVWTGDPKHEVSSYFISHICCCIQVNTRLMATLLKTRQGPQLSFLDAPCLMLNFFLYSFSLYMVKHWNNYLDSSFIQLVLWLVIKYSNDFQKIFSQSFKETDADRLSFSLSWIFYLIKNIFRRIVKNCEAR